MSDGQHAYLRMTIDVCVFTGEHPELETFVKRLKKDAKGPFVDEPLGREVFDLIQLGHIEVDGVSAVEDHT